MAGCGTGLLAIEHALRFPNSEVLGIDLSLVSLAYAQRMADEMGLNNIKFVKADIMQLDTLDKEFDLIECIGVLSHVANPINSCGRLINKLSVNGVMRLSLYSDLARTQLQSVTVYAKENNYKQTIESVRKFRQAILSMPETESIREIIESADFYYLSGLRDLVFHVNEQHYDINFIAKLIHDLNLEFLGFELKSTDVCNAFNEEFPEENSVYNMQSWQSFETQYPNAFLPQYVFWIQQSLNK